MTHIKDAYLGTTGITRRGGRHQKPHLVCVSFTCPCGETTTITRNLRHHRLLDVDCDGCGEHYQLFISNFNVDLLKPLLLDTVRWNDDEKAMEKARRQLWQMVAKHP